MKRIITILCAAIVSLGMANAKLILHESFDGKNGTIGQLSVGATNDPSFWINEYTNDETRWWSYNGSSSYIKVEEGSLSLAGYQTKAIGNKAYLWSTGADDVRSFSSSAVTSGKVYLAALINVAEVKKSASPDYFLCMGDHANSYFLGRLYTKSVQDGDTWTGFKFGISKNNESSTYINYTDAVYSPNTNYLVVIEYEFVDGDKNDTVRLYVNPTKETKVPTLACQQSILGGWDNSEKGAIGQADAGVHGIFGVFMRQGTNTPKVYVDEIKVSKNWNDLWIEKDEEVPVDDPGEGGGDDPGDHTDDIAGLKKGALNTAFNLGTQPIVVYILNQMPFIQDASGAIMLNDFWDNGYLNSLQVGDKLEGLVLAYEGINSEYGLPTARLAVNSLQPTVASSGNALVPFEVSIAELTKYGPALVHLSSVTFDKGALKKFDVGKITIRQDEATAELVVPVGCDAIGKDIPDEASITGVVAMNTASNGLCIRIRNSADIGLPGSGATGFGEVRSETTDVVRSKKMIQNGQLVIVKDGKRFNVLGTEL